MPIDLTEYKEAIDNALENGVSCLVATSSAGGSPNVSLRGSMMVFDSQHLAYWDRVHGRQLEHVAENPRVVVFYRDAPKRMTWRLYGEATVHSEGPIRDQVMARTVSRELDRDPERTGAAVLVKVDLVMTLGSQVLQKADGADDAKPVGAAKPTPERTRDLFEAMSTSRSIRRFRPDPIPDDVLAQLLEAASQAPNGSNAQSWRFMVIRDPKLRRQVGELYRQGFRENFPADRAANEPDPNRRRVIRSADHLAEHMGDEPPVLMMFCVERAPGSAAPSRTGGASVYPAVQNVLLAARALGLGGCLTTLHLRREAQVKEVLGIPENVDTYALLPLGYPATKHGPLRRRPVAEITHYDRW